MKAVDLRPGFVLFMLLLAGLDRSGSLLPFLAAAMLHELSHAAAITLCGGRIRALTFSFADVQMLTTALSYRRELICALAGPLCNVGCCILFSRSFPTFAAFSLLLGLYNLLPVWPLDGGRALFCALMERLGPERAQRVCRTVGVAACAVLSLAGLAASAVLHAGLWPLGMALYLLTKLLILTRR